MDSENKEIEELRVEVKRLSKQYTVAIKNAEKYSKEVKKILDGLVETVEKIEKTLTKRRATTKKK